MRVIVFLVFLCIPFAASADVTGVPRVLSGDTLQIDDQTVKLEGVEAPVPGQQCVTVENRTFSCGNQARTWLAETIGANRIKCLGHKIFRDGMLRAICYLGALNLNGAVVSAGWAVATGRTADRYRKMQRAAEAKGFGVHAGRPDKP